MVYLYSARTLEPHQGGCRIAYATYMCCITAALYAVVVAWGIVLAACHLVYREVATEAAGPEIPATDDGIPLQTIITSKLHRFQVWHRLISNHFQQLPRRP
jgi:hypothetical protein